MPGHAASVVFAAVSCSAWFIVYLFILLDDLAAVKRNSALRGVRESMSVHRVYCGIGAPVLFYFVTLSPKEPTGAVC